jgi:translation initiation factor 2B subunit (eIF-2B alpha/beta/delta family)
MEQCTLSLGGADAVLGYGGVLLQVGTYPLAVCAILTGSNGIGFLSVMKAGMKAAIPILYSQCNVCILPIVN